MCTLIGTSTNLIIAARYDEDYPEEASIGTKAGQSRQEKKRKDESLVVFRALDQGLGRGDNSSVAWLIDPLISVAKVLSPWLPKTSL